MTKEQREELRAILAAAAERPWTRDERRDGRQNQEINSPDGQVAWVYGLGTRLANAELLCAAVNELSGLLDSDERLEAVRAECVNERYPDPGASYTAMAVNEVYDDIVAILDADNVVITGPEEPTKAGTSE